MSDIHRRHGPDFVVVRVRGVLYDLGDKPSVATP